MLKLKTPPAANSEDEQKFRCHEIVDAWNEMARTRGLSTVRVMPSDRTRKLKACIALVGQEGMIEAIGRIGASAHCIGVNDRGWRADFDFLITRSRLIRTLEGRYDNRPERSRNGALDWLKREMATQDPLPVMPDRMIEGPAHG